MARRADIDPTDIPKLLPHVMLVEVLASSRYRYRYRLIGTENAEAHGMNATGRYLDEVLPGQEYKAHVLGLNSLTPMQISGTPRSFLNFG